RAWCRERIVISGRVGTKPRDSRGAEASLAPPHAGTRRLLQRRHRCEAARQLLPQPSRAHLLAPADDGFICNRIRLRRAEQRPQCSLELCGPRECGTRRRILTRRKPEIPRRRETRKATT